MHQQNDTYNSGYSETLGSDKVNSGYSETLGSDKKNDTITVAEVENI